MTPPRIFCIPATSAPVVAVLRRGPTSWYHVGRWQPEAGSYEAGAWLRGRLFPQKCDLSPDGRWLAYSAMKPNARWPAGDIYEAVSRLPWLHALAAWEAGTTYTRGIRFEGEPGTSSLGAPDVGDVAPCLERFGLRLNRAVQFAVERRRGWVETPDTSPRDPDDVWDERRSVRMAKAQPNGSLALEVEGSYAAFRDIPHRREPACYTLADGDDMQPLNDVQWADWDAGGRLLVATTNGRLQVRETNGAGMRVVQEHDLAALRPKPIEPPAWAVEW